VLRYVEPVGAWFAAQMPGNPRREARTFTTPELTRPRITYTVGSASGAERFVIGVTSFERRVPADALSVVTSAMTAAGWRVRDERPITMQGYAGRAYVLEQTGGSTVTDLRVFVAQSRIYEFMATHPAAPDNAYGARVRGFFDSLRIL